MVQTWYWVPFACAVASVACAMAWSSVGVAGFRQPHFRGANGTQYESAYLNFCDLTDE